MLAASTLHDRAFVATKVWTEGRQAGIQIAAPLFGIGSVILAAQASPEQLPLVAFRPEYVPPGTFDGLEAITVGYLSEPLPRPGRPGSGGSRRAGGGRARAP